MGQDDALHARLDALGAQLADVSKRLDGVMDVLKVLVDDESGNRRRLVELRATPEYEAAYTEPDPLVSVLIPTYTNVEGLTNRALPSALAQTHRNLEVVVVGDDAGPEIADAVAAFDDPRVSYINRPVRGPYPEDLHLVWLVAGGPPQNDALEAARGRWIAPFSDDDALRPDAIETTLAEARARRLEFAYGLLEVHHRDGSTSQLGEFPPRLHRFGNQGGVYHAGLRYFEHTTADALFAMPADWSQMRRMLRAGVRVGMVERVVCDYYPSYTGEDNPHE